MKYAILGPRKAINRIFDDEREGTTPITDEQAEQADQIKQSRGIPLLIDGQVTSRLIERDKGNMLMWNEEEGKWNITPIPVKVPERITSWQARAALKLTPYGGGSLFSVVEAALNDLPDNDQKIVITTAWENNANFERDSPTITSLAESIGLTKEQVDSLFILGDSLSV